MAADKGLAEYTYLHHRVNGDPGLIRKYELLVGSGLTPRQAVDEVLADLRGESLHSAATLANKRTNTFTDFSG